MNTLILIAQCAALVASWVAPPLALAGLAVWLRERHERVHSLTAVAEAMEVLR